MKLKWIITVVSLLVLSSILFLNGCAGAPPAAKANAKDKDGVVKAMDKGERTKIEKQIREEIAISYPKLKNAFKIRMDGPVVTVEALVPDAKTKEGLDRYISNMSLPPGYRMDSQLEIGKVRPETTLAKATTDTKTESSPAVAQNDGDDGTEGSSVADGDPIPLQGYKFEGRTYVLLKDVTKALDLTAKWDKTTDAAIVKPREGRGFTASEATGEAHLDNGKLYVLPTWVKKNFGHPVKIK